MNNHPINHRPTVRSWKLLWMLCALAFLTGFIPPAPAAEPVIWFCPLDPLLRPEVRYGGSPEYMDLFAENAPWQKAAKRIKVMKIYPQWISRASDEDLKRQFADLNRRGIALALEYGVLTVPPGRQGIEGFGGEFLLEHARRISRNGGKLAYVEMDEPIFFATIYSGTNSFGWTTEETFANAAKNIKALLAEFPDVKFGDVEPLANVQGLKGGYDELISRYQEGIRAFQKALGFPLAFFDADLDWNSPSFPGNLVALKKMVEKEKIPFGVIYNGDPTDKSDAAWLQSAQKHLTAAERSIGTPERVIFQSWHAYPKTLLPETDPNAFTWLINSYVESKSAPGNKK